LGVALAALAVRMNPADTVAVADRLIKPLENLQKTDFDSLSNLGEALLALVARMDTPAATALAAHGALVLARALEDPSEMDANYTSRLGTALAALATKIPGSEKTRLAGLSLLFLREVSPPPKLDETETQVRTTVTGVCASLSKQQLSEVLKWPVCVGEAQKLVLAALEKKLEPPQNFDGDVWKFVEQVDSLGLRGVNSRSLELPPKRPQITNAIAELQLRTRDASKKP
jgi:hypothetical protein